MYGEITVPTKVSVLEYKNGKFAINCENGDHFLLIEGKTPIWVGMDESSLYESTGFPIEEIQVPDEYGQMEYINAHVFPTSESYNDLDLEALASGSIEWK